MCFSLCVFGREDGKWKDKRVNYYYIEFLNVEEWKSGGRFVFFFSIPFSLFFFPQIEEKKWWAWVENSINPIFFPLPFDSNQTMKNHIFTPLFHLPFSILSLPTKHTVRDIGCMCNLPIKKRKVICIPSLLQNVALLGALLFFVGMKNSIPRRQSKKKVPKTKTV